MYTEIRMPALFRYCKWVVVDWSEDYLPFCKYDFLMQNSGSANIVPMCYTHLASTGRINSYLL